MEDKEKYFNCGWQEAIRQLKVFEKEDLWGNNSTQLLKEFIFKLRKMEEEHKEC